MVPTCAIERVRKVFTPLSKHSGRMTEVSTQENDMIDVAACTGGGHLHNRRRTCAGVSGRL